MGQCTVPLPTTKDRYLGIEIECLVHFGVSRKEEKFVNLPQLMGDERFGPHNLVVHYEYFGGADYGYEVKLLVKESEVDELLPLLTSALAHFGVHFNLNCGCHVHVDCRDRNKELVWRRMDENIVHLKSFTKRNYYSTVCDRGYNTIECRVMEANLDAPRLLAYIHELIHVVDHGVPSTLIAKAA